MEMWRRIIEVVSLTILCVGIACGLIAYAGVIVMKLATYRNERVEWWLGLCGFVMAICGTVAPVPLLIVMGSKLVEQGEAVRGVGFAAFAAAVVPMVLVARRKRGAVRGAFSQQHPHRRTVLYVSVALTCGCSTVLFGLAHWIERGGNVDLA